MLADPKNRNRKVECAFFDSFMGRSTKEKVCEDALEGRNHLVNNV